MISRTAEYALRVMVYLAGRPEKPSLTKDIAEATRIPASYLSKILLTLVRGRFVQSQRGLHGGFVIACDPGKVSVYDVINAVDPLPRILSCPLNLPEHSRKLCPLHKELDRAYEHVEKAFKGCPLADLIAGTFPLPRHEGGKG
jgi:Rrf2 family protein